MSDDKPRVLIVDDERTNINAMGAMLADEYAVSVALSGEQALAAAAATRPDLILLDIVMPGMNGYETCQRLKSNDDTCDVPVIFISALDQLQSKVDGFRAGAVDFLTKPLELEEVLARVRAHLTLRRQMIELEQKNHELESLYQQLLRETEQRQQAEENFRAADAKLGALTAREAKKWGLSAFVGRSESVQALQQEIRRLHAAGRTNVLVLGESGTGKELVARAVHFGSKRSSSPFVAVNCSAVPADLADATFFGSIKGAYTGSVGNRSGYFEEADGGTLFLDEIGDMPMPLQVKLLRVLEEGKITPVGGVKEKAVNVRIVAATNVDLLAQISQKTFRQDLYYRLAGYTIQIPPLRERAGDIGLLARHFVQQYVEEMGYNPVEIDSDAMAKLNHYGFPGNIRELRNLMEYALIRSGGRNIDASHLHFIPSPLVEELAPIEESPSENLATIRPEPAVAARPSAVFGPGPIEAISDFSDDEQVIMHYLTQHSRITNRQCQQLLGVDHSRASYLLKKLHRDGELHKQGERRWAFYHLPESGG